ncbi:hypothetical protein RHSIM_Rhsim01G0035900 [Rhododendron simsii]|uniref:KIB1-4 beta-propeller domain-containing protein n=1 Tax=Rhododendron simsii TaxID=118357 RepID=A0A834LY43_RHOSS|nr:hypothetical protein RHSIM_Rhsim01G0035900 [Rhododendron simsii]
MADGADREVENSQESEKELNRDWASLPTDVLCLMLPQLFLGDIKRFHNVCRSWRSAPTDQLVQSPVLMCLGNDSTRCKFFHPLYRDSYSMYIPELFGAVPRFSKDGWLLMSRGKYSVFFFNPFTKALINLPDLPNKYNFGGITITSSPTLSDCKSFHHGEFYCLGRHGNLGVFNPGEDYWRVLDKPHRQPPLDDPIVSHKRNFLMECNGELLSVSMSFMGKLILVSKLDSVEMVWHKVDSLGDQMLFVSHTSSLSAKRVVQGMENKIYLPRVHGKCGVFYSLANGLFQTLGNDFTGTDLHGTGELLSCCWIEPKANTSYSEEELNWFEDA